MSSRPTSAFRPDIEGLRAIAVLLVVACHTKLPGFQGAFIGVDVFFVISGYLVTRLLLREREAEGRIDFLAFYARRMRRLLPAFWVMLAFVIAATWVIYAPIEQPGLLASAFAAALYFSNFHYALTSTDYMAPSAKLDPLLHTWSLGVEEQFYLLWPLLVLAGGLLGRQRPQLRTPLLLLVAGIGSASFIACVVLTGTRQPWAFFLPFTRAWEFGLGAAVVLLEPMLPALRQRAGLAPLFRRQALAAIAGLGLLLVILPALLLGPHSPFPGVAALLPAGGTALLLLLIPLLPAENPVRRGLATPALQWLGARSYSWYLWHWPLLVLGRVVTPEHSLAWDLTLAGVALLLAHLSHVLVENPIRYSPRLRRNGLAFACAILVPLGSALLIKQVEARADVYSHSERFQRFGDTWLDMPLIYAHAECDEEFYSSRVVPCVAGAPNGRHTAVLFGDSHAGQWFTAMHEILRQEGWKLILLTKSACPIIDEVHFYERIGRDFVECAVWRNTAVVEIRALRPDLVVVANSEEYPFSPAQWNGGTERMMAAIAAGTRQLVILRDTPHPGFDPLACLARKEWNPGLSWASCVFDAGSQHSPAVLQAYRATAQAHPNIRIVDMNPFICSRSPCEITAGDLIKFRDASHLADHFVRTLIPPLRNELVAAGAFGRESPPPVLQAALPR